MKLEQAIDSKNFLQHDWQKRARVFRNVFSNTETLISGDELAGLACEEDIESRIITGGNEMQNWQCQFGPFDGFDYDTLGPHDWTLLVQSVDHFLPEVRQILEHFNFIPKWRLDDVMLSYAPPGGGVGPHFDYYDVFLIQLSGSREWKVGQVCAENTVLREHTDLKLLQRFNETESHQLHPGDMIYIPAGVAHWGTARSDNCITASVGFRAPSYQDLVYSAALELSEDFNTDQRYKDDGASIEVDSFDLTNTAQAQFEKIYNNLDKDKFANALRIAFAKEVTTPRHEELFEFCDIDDTEVSSSLGSLHKHPNARFVYLERTDSTTLFANGLEFETDLKTAKAICHEQFSLGKAYDTTTLAELCRLGFLIIE